jgi:hypothetical protein
MIDPRDLEACTEAIRHGSLSFHAASKLLPKNVRDPVLALYAFCRLADDEVDLKSEKIEAVLRLRDRLELVYDGDLKMLHLIGLLLQLLKSLICHASCLMLCWKGWLGMLVGEPMRR